MALAAQARLVTSRHSHFASLRCSYRLSPHTSSGQRPFVSKLPRPLPSSYSARYSLKSLLLRAKMKALPSDRGVLQDSIFPVIFIAGAFAVICAVIPVVFITGAFTVTCCVRVVVFVIPVVFVAGTFAVVFTRILRSVTIGP